MLAAMTVVGDRPDIAGSRAIPASGPSISGQQGAWSRQSKGSDAPVTSWSIAWQRTASSRFSASCTIGCSCRERHARPSVRHRIEGAGDYVGGPAAAVAAPMTDALARDPARGAAQTDREILVPAGLPRAAAGKTPRPATRHPSGGGSTG